MAHRFTVCTWTLMHDDDNDGEVGGTDIETYTRSQMMQSPYGDWEDWNVFWIVN